MTRRARHFARLAALALGLAAAGCSNPFLPAQAPSPTAGGGSSFTPDYQSDEGVLTTVTQAIGVRNAIGENAYLKAFADSATYGFNCTFGLGDSVRAVAERSGQPAPAVWRLEYEPAFYRYLTLTSDVAASVSGDYEMTFFDTSPPEKDDNPHTRTLFHRSYVVDAGTADSPVHVAEGKADIEVRLVAPSRWAIVSWSDDLYPGISASTSDPGEFCFSRLRIDSYYHTETTP
jgi:hypothetical protein